MISSRRLRFGTESPTEFLDITGHIQGQVDSAGLRQGRVFLQSMHTTLGLLVNENEPLLLGDLQSMLDRLVPTSIAYRHDDFPARAGIGPDEPANGHAHCRQALLQPSVTALVENGRLVLGRWQSIFAVELDGPRAREIAVQLDGEFAPEAEASRDGPTWIDSDLRLLDLELRRQLEVDPEAVGSPMRGLVQAGGKRLRPRLVLLCSRLAGQPDRLKSVLLAAAIELIHNATLVHDDYVDESPFRHGVPTVAAREGSARAVAVGDYYFAKATRIIAELGNRTVTQIVAEALEAICRAQIDDLTLRGSYPGDRDSYLGVVGGKTASLLAASCAAGASLAGAAPELVTRMARYGELLGIAFQMADDVIDFSRESGKPMGQDVRQRTLSLPLIYATDDPVVGPRMRALLDGPLPESDVQEVVALVQDCGALERVQDEARSLAEAAVAELDGLAHLNGSSPDPTLWPDLHSRLESIARGAAARTY